MSISSSLIEKKKNGLEGITDETRQKLAQYESGYKQSDKVNQAYDSLQKIQQNKPGEYSSKYTDQLDSLYNQIINRPDFKYDLASDALYQQYKDQYQKQGKLAMMDTMGQASALTGGYGSSYASTAGNQAFQGYLSQLNNKVPELYQLAYQKYMDQGTDLKDKYSVTKDADTTDYSKYRDKVSDYNNDLNFASGVYNNERSLDYNDFSNMLSYYQNKAGQENTDWWKQADFDQSKAQADREYALQQAQLAETTRSNRASEANAANKASYEAQIKALQAQIAADNESKPTSSANTKAFQANIMTPQEFSVRTTGSQNAPGAYQSYKEYVKSTLNKWYDSKQLNEGEVSYLLGQYGI